MLKLVSNTSDDVIPWCKYLALIPAFSVTDVRKATDHLSQQRAFLGAQINKSELQKDALDQRIISTSEKISDIDTADMAALVTRLQALLLNKDAAQQAYAKIGQNSLFDYLK